MQPRAAPRAPAARRSGLTNRPRPTRSAPISRSLPAEGGPARRRSYRVAVPVVRPLRRILAPLALAALAMALAVAPAAAARSSQTIVFPSPGSAFRLDLGSITISGIRTGATEADPGHVRELVAVATSSACAIGSTAPDEGTGELTVTVTFVSAGACGLRIEDPGTAEREPVSATRSWIQRGDLVVYPVADDPVERIDGTPAIVYGTAAPTYHAEASGLQPGDTLATAFITLPVCGPTSYAPGARIAGGPYAVRCSGGITSGTYTNVTYRETLEGDGALRLTPAPGPTVTAPSLNIERSDSMPPLAPTISGLVGADVFPTPPVCRVYTDAPEPVELEVPSERGGYLVRCSGGDAGPDYGTAVYVDGRLEVGERILTVAPAETFREYGSEATIAVDSFGWVLDEAWLGTPDCRAYTDESYTLEVGPDAPIGDYPTICAGGDAGPAYTIARTPGILHVVPATITVRPFDATRRFGDPNPPLAYETSGPAGAGVFLTPPSCTTGAEAASPAGTYAIECTGGRVDSNHAIAYARAKLTVERRVLHLVATSASKVYGEPDPELDYAVAADSDPLLAGDLLAGSPTRAAGEDVGAYRIGAGSLGAGESYRIVWDGADLEITQAPAVSYVPAPASRQYGDDDPVFGVIATGFRGADDWIVAPRCTADRRGADRAGRIDTIRCAGGDAGPNYAGPARGSGTARLTTVARTLVLAAPSLAKAYGEPDPALAPDLGGARLVGNDRLTGALTRVPGERVGEYAISASALGIEDGVGGANYAIERRAGSLRITARPLGLAAVSASKTYDGTNEVEAAPKIASGTLADGDRLASATLRFASPHAGDGVALEVAGVRIVDRLGAEVTDQYALTTSGASGRIRPLAVSVRASPDSKVYDGTTDSALAPSISPPTLPDTFSATQRFADRHAGTAKRLIPSLELAPGTRASDYEIVLVESDAGLISPRPITVRAVAQTKIYDGTNDSTLEPTFDPPPVAGDVARFRQAFVSEKPGARRFTIEGSVADGNGGRDYRVVADESAIGQIDPITLTPEVTVAERPYDGSTDVAVESCRLNGSIITGEQVSCDLAAARGRMRDAAPGAAKEAAVEGLRLRGRDAANYALADGGRAIGLVRVRPGDQSLEFPPLDAVVYGDRRALGIRASSGLPAVIEVRGDCRIEAGEVVATGVGACTIVAAQGGDENWSAAEPIERTISIGRRPIAVSASAVKTYGESDPALEIMLAEGSLIGGDRLTGTPLRTPGEHAGEYEIAQGALTAPPAYELRWVPGSLTIRPAVLAVAPLDAERPYGGEDPKIAYRTTGWVGQDGWVRRPLCTSDIGPADNAGDEGLVTCAGGDPGSDYSVVYRPGRIRVVPRAVTVTIGSPTKMYGDADPPVDYTVDPPLLGDDAFAGTLARLPGEAVGEYAISAESPADFTLVSDHPGNYDLRIVPGRLRVIPRRITIAPAPDTKVYDGTSASIARPLIVEGTLANDDAIATAQAFSSPQVGDGPLMVTELRFTRGDPADYQIRFATVRGRIEPRPLTIAATPVAKVYDGTRAASGRPVWVGDTRPVPGEEPILAQAFERADAGPGVLVSPLLDFPEGSARNYRINVVSALGEIRPRPISIRAVPETKTYDGTVDATLTPIVGAPCDQPGGLVCGHALHLRQRFDTPRAGEQTVWALRSGPLVSDGLLDVSANYAPDFEPAAGRIEPRPITIVADAQQKFVRQSDPPLTARLTNGSLAPGDTLVGRLARLPGETVGSYEITLGTRDAGPAGRPTVGIDDYAITFVPARLEILPPPGVSSPTILIRADDATRPYGSADRGFTHTASGAEAWAAMSGSPACAAYTDWSFSRLVGTDTPAGRYPIHCRIGSFTAAGHLISFADGILTISAHPAAGLLPALPADAPVVPAPEAATVASPYRPEIRSGYLAVIAPTGEETGVGRLRLAGDGFTAAVVGVGRTVQPMSSQFPQGRRITAWLRTPNGRWTDLGTAAMSGDALALPLLRFERTGRYELALTSDDALAAGARPAPSEPAWGTRTTRTRIDVVPISRTLLFAPGGVTPSADARSALGSLMSELSRLPGERLVILQGYANAATGPGDRSLLAARARLVEAELRKAGLRVEVSARTVDAPFEATGRRNRALKVIVVWN